MNVPMACVSEQEWYGLRTDAARLLVTCRRLLLHPSLELSPAERERVEQDVQALGQQLRPDLACEEIGRVSSEVLEAAPF